MVSRRHTGKTVRYVIVFYDLVNIVRSNLFLLVHILKGYGAAYSVKLALTCFYASLPTVLATTTITFVSTTADLPFTTARTLESYLVSAAQKEIRCARVSWIWV
jgi:hypothetical protein